MEKDARHIEANKEAEGARPFAAAVIALTMLLFSRWSLNCNLFPLYAEHVFMLREICTLANGAVLISLAFVSASKPHLISPLGLIAAGVGGAFAGAVLIGVGSASSNAALIVGGACLTSIAEGSCTIVVMLSVVALDAQRAMACIVIGELGSIVLRPLCPIGYSETMLAVHACLLIGSSLLAAPSSRRTAEALRGDTPARDLAITQPSSALPLGHQLFICLFLFRILYGLMLTFGESNGAPVHSSVDFLPPVILLALLAARHAIVADGLFKAAILLSIAGLLLMPASAIVSFDIIQGFLSCGVVIFEVFNLVVLVSLSRRNIHGAIAVFSWGWALNSIGVVFGANMGRAINANWVDNPSFAVVATAALTFCFIAYVILFLQEFSFEKTISGVQAPTPVVPPAIEESTTHDLDECCDEIAEECSLTKRETEVLKLLARGRSGVFIQNELVVSYNTVKSHVKHIYMKTGAHTHQELIDLVEEHRREAASN